MTVHFQHELEKIKKAILSLGAMAEERVYMATKAIVSSDQTIARKIIDHDFEIDEMEVEIEEECLKVLALHQPVAVDLRFIVAVIKINNDLERIGDEAVNIAHRIIRMAKIGQSGMYFDYTDMVEKVRNMLRKSLDSMVNLDLDEAYHVRMLDDEVDNIRDEAYEKMKGAIREDPEHLQYLVNLYLISRHLERVADHATNIAEEVIYLIEGEIVRHGKF